MLKKDESFYNQVGNDRISTRQIDELIGLTRGICADGMINQAEAEFLQKWLAAGYSVSSQPVLKTLYHRIAEMLGDGQFDEDERAALFQTLTDFSNCNFELGEVLKSTTLPLCQPAPPLTFTGKRYTFTGTFKFGTRSECERKVLDRGAAAGTLTRATDFLVIGVYATESWKHSSFGDKIIKACEMRDRGVPIAIVSEEHWTASLG